MRFTFSFVAMMVITTACAHSRHFTQQNSPVIPMNCSSSVFWSSSVTEDAERAALSGVSENPAFAGMSHFEKEELSHQLASKIKWWMVRSMIVGGKTHNAGSVLLPELHDQNGNPVRVYRTGITNNPLHPKSCFRSILQEGHVQHVLNLYEGKLPAEDLLHEEEQVAHELGVSYYHPSASEESQWRQKMKSGIASEDQAQNIVAKMIQDHIVHPNGRGSHPQGNIYLHCGGGMHRTGMFIGILQKCFAHASQEVIEKEYKKHVAFKSNEEPGGFEQENLNFIAHFDCSKLAE